MDSNVSVEGPGKRMSYLDNLRSLVIFLVVVMHSTVTYSGMGGWYYKEGNAGSLDFVSRALFALYGGFTQAWFMGILFFLAAFFAARSLAKRGTWGFLKERLFRLGLPLLLYMLVLEPLIGYFLINYGGIRYSHSFLEALVGYWSSFRWLGGTGPLWFAEALLGFSAVYALYRAVRPASGKASSAPSTLGLALMIVAIGLAAFSIRLFQPIGSSIANLQFSFFASYVALFALGIHAGERGWLPSFPEKPGLRWFGWSAGLGVALWFVLMIAGGALRGRNDFGGGMYWQSFAYAFWEAGVAVGMSVGLVVFFRRFLNVENRLTRLLAANSFGVYMFHAPVLIAVSRALRPWHAPMMAKHLVVAPLAFALTLALSALILRRIPGLRSVLK